MVHWLLPSYLQSLDEKRAGFCIKGEIVEYMTHKEHYSLFSKQNVLIKFLLAAKITYIFALKSHVRKNLFKVIKKTFGFYFINF